MGQGGGPEGRAKAAASQRGSVAEGWMERAGETVGERLFKLKRYNEAAFPFSGQPLGTEVNHQLPRWS